MELIPGGTLMTATPEAGRLLAMTMARKSNGAIQPDGEVRKALRPDYANYLESLTWQRR